MGKRVDYSGRSVIVVGPELKLHQCGLPKEMALELFKPFVMKKLATDNNLTIKAAKKKVDRATSDVWGVLEEVIKEHPVLLNRAPTLHRLGIQAFEPVLTEGRALKLHPLACTAYNADFDGDQMAIHLPLSAEAQAEARVLMLAANHILAPKDGKPIIVPTQDMVLGTYYLTKIRRSKPERPVLGEGRYFTGIDEALLAYENHVLDLQAEIFVMAQGLGSVNNSLTLPPDTSVVKTSLGRMIFNEKLPPELRQYHQDADGNWILGSVMNKKALGKLVAACFNKFGATRTAEVIDEVKRLGYHYACIAGMTVAISDVIVPPKKQGILAETSTMVKRVETFYLRGALTERERYDKVCALWSEATNKVADAMMENMDEFNPIYMMSDSGARGNKQQMRQLAGMRGLMADPSGKIIDLPITANFREGLSVSDYFISSHGARKGLADTALRTADSGYLTRRLVDVAQDVIVRSDDCDITTVNLLLIRARLAEDTFDALEILNDVLLGRVLVSFRSDNQLQTPNSTLNQGQGSESGVSNNSKLQTQLQTPHSSLQTDNQLLTPNSSLHTDTKLLTPNSSLQTEIVLDEEALIKLGETGVSEIVLRGASLTEPNAQKHSRLTETIKLGTSSDSERAAIREAFINEYIGKQLALTGEILTREMLDNLIDEKTSPSSPYIQIRNNNIRGILVESIREDTHNETGTRGVIEHLHDRIIGRFLAENIFDSDGNLIARVNDMIDDSLADKICSVRDKVLIRSVLTCKAPQGVCKKCYGQDLANRTEVEIGEAVGIIAAQSIGEPGTQLTMRTFHTGGVAGGDITQGLPRVEELFEARKPKNNAIISEIDGIISWGDPDKNGLRTIVVTPFDTENLLPREYSIPFGIQPRVKEGDTIRAGDTITDGAKNPHDILRICGLKETHRYLVKEVQKVYKSQGVEINDKHIEVMVRQMLHKVNIQRNSYEWFKKEGLQEIFRDVSPIADFSGNLELFFEGFTFGECKYSLDECKHRDGTFAAPVRVKVKLLNKSKGDVKEQEVFMGDFPIMTDTGTFIINGAERVIVSQLVRSPGSYYEKTIDQSGKNIFTSTVIPNRGAWIELETDSSASINVRIDRTRKMPVTYFIRSLDYETNEQILELFDIKYFIQSKIHDEVTSAQLADFLAANPVDSRDNITIGYIRRQGNKTAETFDALLDAYNQLDNKNDLLSNFKYLLDNLAALDDKNYLSAGYKALVDLLDLDRKNAEDNKEKALIGIYNRLRPGEPPSAENSASLLHSQFFDPRRYDLAQVGRYKITKKLGWKRRLLGKILAEDLIDFETGEILIPADDNPVTQEQLDAIPDEREAEIFNLQPDELRRGYFNPIPIRVKTDAGNFTMLCAPTLSIKNNRTLCIGDMMSAIGYVFDLFGGTGVVDDIDHLGNRRVRAVGELLQNQFRIGMARMERVVRERMTSTDADIVTPQNLINIRPVVAAIKEFFGSSQLSQFMDQHNPLSELTHKRRLSALGPGGLSRERAGFEVRDVHNSHYGRMCPIETPEGPNIGLIGSLSNFARVNQYGFIETPYRRVENNRVSNEVDYLTADEEEKLVIAQANEPLDDNDWFVNERVTARVNEETTKVRRERVQYMDVSPKQVVSIATALIPFLENDDANRALMGANMQRQAVPLLKTQAPLVGTGMEFKAACDSGVMILAKRPGTVTYVDSATIRVRVQSQGAVEFDTYHLQKFVRSNQGTCINQIPLVDEGEHISARQPIADGPATSGGELALGYNIIVAYMPWEGYNYEDAILLSENLIKRDIFTSIHIEEYQCDARDTKLGPEEVTRDIPNVSEDSLVNLDSEGIIAIGADVRTGDILVGKVTPKGETELTAEERLLRAIFGEKAREVRDTSLRVPHGESGKVVAVNVFTRDNNDEMAPGVNKQVRVYIAQKRKISVGDKMSGRHGNKGVVSEIRRQEDMPFLPDGTPVDIVLNPLGVPSRMNIGQILETHLGMAVRQIGIRIKQHDTDIERDLCHFGFDVDHFGLPVPSDAGVHIATPVFDGARDNDLLATIQLAKLDSDGKTVLFDGRTGLPFENRVTVGCVYMLKLHHLVDDKIHARSTGPYSLVTQQPLGGKAQFGGQRFGEMEVWALEAYGASYTLQEILTVKSDDVLGRVKAYEAIVKGQNIPEPGVPESFKVLIKELQSIGLDIRVLSGDSKEIIIKDDDDDDKHVTQHDLPIDNSESHITDSDIIASDSDIDTSSNIIS